MKLSSDQQIDYKFGQSMLQLRESIGLTQAALGLMLGVSRRTIGTWELGNKFPNAAHLRHFIAVAIEQRAFPAGREVAAIRALWQGARLKVPLDEAWLAGLLAPAAPAAETPAPPAVETRQSALPRRPQSNLPFQPTPLLGRAAEIAALNGILSNPNCRLLTLVGPGGIGKTRLAVALAERQAGAFADGVVFVPLAAVNAADRIAAAIAVAIGLAAVGQYDPQAQLLADLRGQQLLLLLDNCDHLLDGADLVNSILQAAPRVTIMVTSRERLNLQAEWLFDVEGLAYPQPAAAYRGAPRQPGDPADFSAMQLFIDRARQLQAGLVVGDADLAAIEEIARHVAGMPLAIELAAANVRFLPIVEIERQLRSNLALLTTTRRDVPQRHRSMSAVCDQSWELLSAEERDLFSRLAVFRGGCTAAAATAVAGATRAGLIALVDKSLVRHVSAPAEQWAEPAHAGGAIGPRFTMLEPVREYAWAKLAARGELDTLQGQHARYFLALAQALDRQWDAPNADELIAQLEREYDNIRAALLWARDGGDLTTGLQLAVALRRYWQRRGYFSEGGDWLEALLARPPEGASKAALTARAGALHAAAWLASDRHDYARSARLFEGSAALRRELGDTTVQASMLAHAAREARAAGRYAAAGTLLQDALAQLRAMGDRGLWSSGGLGLALYELGLARREQGDFAAAASLFEESLQLHRAAGDREGMAVGLLGLSDLARDQARAGDIRTHARPSLALCEELGMQWARGFAIHNLALAAYLDGDLNEAGALISASVDLFRSLQGDASLGEVLITQSSILRARGEVRAAFSAVNQALRLTQAVGPRLLVAAAAASLAGLLAEAGALPEAVQLLGAAAALRRELGTPLRPLDQALQPIVLAQAREILGAESYAANWQLGWEQPLAATLAALPDLD